MTEAKTFAFSLEGQDAPRANTGTNWSGGPLRGWYELEFIPCRVVLQPGSNQVVQINFDHTKNSSVVKRGIENLYYFSASPNVTITTPQLTGLSSQEEWYYTFTANVSGTTNGYVYYYSRMFGGAHLFGGSSLAMFYPPLQIMKPGPVAGNPDLSVTKTGPSVVYAGATYTYTLAFSNSASATATAVGVQLSDFLPDGTTYVDGSATTSGLATNLTVLGNQLWWDVSDMPRGSSGTITYKVAVPSTFTNSTTIKNYAQIESAQDDANELDNIASVTSTVMKAPPVANDDMYSVNRNQTLTINGSGVLANDNDPTGLTLNALLATNVTSGTLTLNTNGSLTYIPASNFVGTVTFYYIATNGLAASAPAKVIINVLQLAAPSDPTVSCVSSIPVPATNLTQFVAQGGIASSPYCGQPTSVTFLGDSSNGGSGCPASPLIITRTYRLTTGCGDTTNVTQTFTISDSTVPTITSFPPDATCSCAAEVSPANDSLIGKSDNCTGTVTVSHDADVIAAGSCANRYTIARTYRVSDSCGNATSRTQHITIIDQTAPTISAFPADATYSCIDAVPGANINLVTAFDNCTGSVTVAHDADVITESNCVNRLTITRVYRATDSCGNATSKTQTITVNGSTPPTITAFPADSTYSCVDTVPAPSDSLVSATNACGGSTGVTITHNTDVITSSNCANRFTITRTYVATDACGNSSSKSQNITVNGTTPPTIITFPADASYSCAGDVPAANDASISATNACGGVAGLSVTHDADIVTSSNCVNRLTIKRTYRITDACGNAISKTQTITVNGTTPPTITAFPADATYSCANAVPAANDILVTATNSCGGVSGVTITHGSDVITASNCVNRFTITRAYLATDACGNVTSKTQKITIDGSAPPTITSFPADQTVSCVDSVPPANNGLVSAVDNCGSISSVTISHDADVITSSNCVNRLTIARTYRATDACGNMIKRTQIITVNATTAPVITTFPADATYSCSNAVPPPNNTLIQATNACGGTASLTISHNTDVVTSSNCVNHFIIRRTYIATDACGNSASKSQTITVDGTTPPTITAFPADVSVSCLSAVPAADDSLVTATDNCGASSVTVTHDADIVTSSNCVNRFTITRTYHVTDACGNATLKSQIITVNATTAPSIAMFPADVTVSCASAVPAADDSLVSAADGCGGSYGVVIRHNADVVTSTNCLNHFTIKRTYIATDACGNSASKNQLITVSNTNAPIITAFPADVTLDCVTQGLLPLDASVSTTSACGDTSGIFVTHNPDVIASSNCPGRFSIARTYVVTDICGNSTSRTQTITYNVTSAPTFTEFPINATYSCASAVPAADNGFVIATNHCNRSAAVITHTPDIITSSNCVNHFTITRTYIATDACGNSASKVQTIIVNGTTPPTIRTFPDDATYACATAVPMANDSLVTAVDNCGASTVTITHDTDLVTSSNCVNRFVIQRTYRVSDACGNAISKTQIITVNGTIAPTIATFPSDATYSCASAVPAANNSLVTATDGCGASSSIVITHNGDVVTSSNCVNHFTIARTYVATDACGNSNSKIQTITVDGTTPPTVTTFPNDAIYSCAGQVPPANDSLVAASDNCGAASVTITHDGDRVSESNCPNHFIISRTYHATDACGNSISRTQTITVHDTTAPSIRPPLLAFSNYVYSCSSEVPPADDSIISAVDNCGGEVIVTHEPDVIVSSNCVNRFTIRRTYHVTDSCGNSTNVVQTIRVEATTAPTITAFPNDATYTCSSAVPAADDRLVTAIDGCGTGQVRISHGADEISSAICDNRYIIRRTYTAVDSCGNSSSKTQVMTINNTTPPVITEFPYDATYSCAAEVESANNNLVAATNACGDRFGMVITHTADVITSSNCANRFTIARTYIATDSCGNFSSKTQTLTVNATTPPTVSTFPSDVTVPCVGAVPSANDTLVAALDGCGSVTPVITHSADVIISSNCVNRFTIARTYIATDSCGNSASKTQSITVNGTNAPVITAFPLDVTVECSTSLPAADHNLVEAIDTCGVASISVTHDNDVIVSNICANHFVIARTYHVTDTCGNATSRTQTITVNDTIAPTISCPPGFTVSHFDDIPSPNSELVDASDNCSVPLKMYVGQAAVTNNSIVTITRTFAASDECGNSSTCTQVITMNPFLAQPTARPDSYSVLENSTLNISAPGVLANDTDPNNLALRALLVSGPLHGTVMLNANGSFQYIPETYYVGTDTFVYQPSNGGNAPGAPVTVTVTVNFVNQQPSFTKGPNQIINNYDGPQSRINWASNISPGPANESSQTVQFIVSNDNNSIFSSQPAISASGTLTYTPAPNKFGTSVVSVALKDNGGTANGGKDTSLAQMFSIIVNNPPTAAINTPTNTSLFLYPAPVDITATATDIDGIVTNVTFFNGTSAIGQGTPNGTNKYTFTWTNAPASNSVLYALATDNYGATNLSAPINIQLGNPVGVVGGAVVFSPSLFSWGQKLSVTNPTISTVQSVTVTFTGVLPSDTSILGVTGTNSLGQPYITFNNTVPPVTGIDNYATMLYVASSKPTVTFTTTASLSQGPGFTVSANTVVPISRRQFQNDGSFLLNFVSQTNHTYFVQYTSDFKQWFTSPLPLKGNGTQLQWVDVGPIVTVSTPRSVPYRYYRVVSQ